MRALFVLSAICLPAAAFAQDPEMRLVDMVVAQVDTTVVTWSELTAETRLVMLRSKGPELARTGAMTEGLLRAVLRAIVSRELLLSEARRLHLREASEAEIQAAIAEILRRFEAPGDAQRFFERVGLSAPSRESAEIAPPGLVAILRAELQVGRFINLRIKPSVVFRESDVQRCYDENKHLLGSEPLSAVRPLIERALRQAKSDASLDALVAQLAKKATLRFAPGFELNLGAPQNRASDGMELTCKPPDELAP